MIHIKSASNKTLNIILANTNKALNKVLQDIAPKELQTLTQAKDLGSVLESLLKNNTQNDPQNKALVTMLKNNPTLKELGNMSQSLKDLQTTLQNTKPETLSPSLTKLKEILPQKLDDTIPLNEKGFKNKLENSGIFLESKLKNFTEPKSELKSLIKDLTIQLQSSKLPNAKVLLNDTINLLDSKNFLTNTTDSKTTLPLTQQVERLMTKVDKQISSPIDKAEFPKDTLFSKETKNILTQINTLNRPEKLNPTHKIEELFSNDLKAVVSKSIQELQKSDIPQKHEMNIQLEKISLQIDYYQLLSHLSNASCIYLPYSFEALEEGNITIKKATNKKFFCDIDLQLKEYGSLYLRLGLFEKKQLNINIECESNELQKMLQENLDKLKKSLFDVGLYPQDIRFLNTTPKSQTYLDSQDLKLGFEVKA